MSVLVTVFLILCIFLFLDDKPIQPPFTPSV